MTWPGGGARVAVLAAAVAVLAIACSAALAPEIAARWRFRAWRRHVVEHTLTLEERPPPGPRDLGLLGDAVIGDIDEVAETALFALQFALLENRPGAEEALERVARGAGAERRRWAIDLLWRSGGEPGLSRVVAILGDEARAADPARRNAAVHMLARMVIHSDDATWRRLRTVLASVLGTAEIDAHARAAGEEALAQVRNAQPE